MRLGRRDALLVALAATAVLVVVAPALAQAPPPAFGPRPPAPTGITGWILEQQVQFYRQLSATVRAIRAGNAGAFWTLVSLSFLYGVFHAAGPGHGKAVISSYIVATGETVRRGVTLAALSSLVQALTAIALVGLLAAILGTTARTMRQVVNIVELVGYGLIVVIGLRLLWQKGRAFLVRFRAWRQAQPVAGVGCDDNCVHLPAAEQVARIHSWREALAIIVTVGLRPCTGAILVLVFALSQGIIQAGIAATFAMAVGTAITVAAIAALASGAKSLAVRLASARPGATTVLLSGVEVGAAVLVILFGAGLLTGYLVTEGAMPF